MKSGTAAGQPSLAEAVLSVGQLVIVGGVVSFTVKVVGQAANAPLEFVAVMVTAVVPRPTSVPAVGLWVMVGAQPGLLTTVVAVKVGYRRLAARIGARALRRSAGRDRRGGAARYDGELKVVRPLPIGQYVGSGRW